MEENKHPEIIVTKSDQNQDNLREALKNAIEDASNDIEMKTLDVDLKDQKKETELEVGKDLEMENENPEYNSKDTHPQKDNNATKISSKEAETQIAPKSTEMDGEIASKRVLFKKKIFRSGYQKRYEVKPVDDEGNKTRKSLSGGEIAVDFKIVVEEFRFYWYLLFCLMLLLGVVITKVYTPSYFGCDKYGSLLASLFGSINMCVYFDFPPVTYVLPSIYSMVVVFAHFYATAAVFRAWISKEEKRISKRSFKIYCGVMIYFALSMDFFATIFAVPPNLAENPFTIQIHTLPYTNLCIALCLLQICVTWFGINVAWTELNSPKILRVFSIGGVGVLAFTAISKIILHINALGDVGRCNPGQTNWTLNWTKELCESEDPDKFCGKGLIWSVHSEGSIIFSKFVEMSFLLSALIAPLFQCGYLYFRHFRTHHIIFSVRDNKEARKSIT